MAPGVPPPGPGPEVVLYGRPGCHLCDDARDLLVRVARDLPFRLVERDIEADERLLRAYLERIPVVTVDGEEAFELFVEEAPLRARLEAAGAGPPVAGRPPQR